MRVSRKGPNISVSQNRKRNGRAMAKKKLFEVKPWLQEVEELNTTERELCMPGQVTFLVYRGQQRNKSTPQINKEELAAVDSNELVRRGMQKREKER